MQKGIQTLNPTELKKLDKKTQPHSTQTQLNKPTLKQNIY